MKRHALPPFLRTALTLSLLTLLGLPAAMLVIPGLLPVSLYTASAATVEKDLADAQSMISRGKLHDARNILEKARQNATGATVTTRINKLAARIVATEDSLAKVNLDILRTRGADAAFEYMQEVVWSFGVSKEKLDMIENAILNEAPAVQEIQERDDLEHAVNLLEAEKPMDTAIDPYIVKTAEMLVQARADSIKNAELDAVAREQVTVPVVPATPPVVEKPPVTEPSADSALPVTAPVEKPAATPTAAEPIVEKAAEPVVPEPAVQPKEEPVTTVAVVTPPPKPKKAIVKPIQKPEEYISPALQARAQATKEYLKQLKANQQVAQATVVELYTMLEKDQGREAMRKFRDRRAFISKYVSPQVFNILELTLAQTVIDAQGPGGAAAARSPASSAPEQTMVDRLNALMRQNRVEAAYKEFKREEQSLKKFMGKSDFRQLKKMIEDAYTLRTGIKNKK